MAHNDTNRENPFGPRRAHRPDAPGSGFSNRYPRERYEVPGTDSSRAKQHGSNPMPDYYSRYTSGKRYAARARQSTTASRERCHTRSSGVGYQPARNVSASRRRGPLTVAQALSSLLGGGNGGRGGRGGNGRGATPNPSRTRLGLIAAGIVALVIVVFAWTHRPVEVTLNGNRTTVTVGSTIEQVVAKKGLTPKAGNLISVNGTKLQDGQGYAYVAKLAGNELDGAATEAYRAKAGDDLSIEDGRDRTEDFDVTQEDVAPKLVMDGDVWGNLTYVSQWGKAGKKEVRHGKVSGETADGTTLAEAQDCKVTVHQVKPANDEKLVAITFDDGPTAVNDYTKKYLDILKQHDAKATFFNLGQMIDEYPQLAKQIADSGNEVMSHTNQHQQLTALDAPALQQEITSTFDKIKSATGVETTAFRPPYGAYDEKAWLNSGGTASVSVLWNQDSEDWRRPGVDALVANATKGVTPGSIILMHDGGGNRDQDVDALPKIIEQLQGQGYKFVTVTELMKSDPAIPADIAGGNAKMPDDAVWPTELA